MADNDQKMLAVYHWNCLWIKESYVQENVGSIMDMKFYFHWLDNDAFTTQGQKTENINFS